MNAIEVHGKIDGERRHGRVGLPQKRFVELLGRRVVGSMTLDDSLVRVDHPGLGDALLGVQRTLALAIGSRRGW